MISAPYTRAGTRRDIARQWETRGERLKQGVESLLTVAKTPCASPCVLEKCVNDTMLGLN